MSFSQLINSIRGDAGNLHVTVSEDWTQGRATFGGLVAAIGNEAMRRSIPADRALRSLQTTFVGPASASTWQISTRVLRVGRAVTIASCEILDDDQVVATQIGVYGGARASAVNFKPQPVAVNRVADEIQEVRFQPDRSAAFSQHFAVRWAEGAKPFSGSVNTPNKAYVRHRDAAPTTESAIIALIDCIPTAAMSMFSAPAPASSLTWNLGLIEQRFDFDASAWWRIDSDVDAAADGYVNQTSVLNDPDGRPVALSRQLFAIFN